MLMWNPRVALLVTQTKEPRENNPLVSSVPADASVPWVVPPLIPLGKRLWCLPHRLAAKRPGGAWNRLRVFLLPPPTKVTNQTSEIPLPAIQCSGKVYSLLRPNQLSLTRVTGSPPAKSNLPSMLEFANDTVAVTCSN